MQPYISISAIVSTSSFLLNKNSLVLSNLSLTIFNHQEVNTVLYLKIKSKNMEKVNRKFNIIKV